MEGNDGKREGNDLQRHRPLCRVILHDNNQEIKEAVRFDVSEEGGIDG